MDRTTKIRWTTRLRPAVSGLLILAAGLAGPAGAGRGSACAARRLRIRNYWIGSPSVSSRTGASRRCIAC